jgi:hypothetical protein
MLDSNHLVIVKYHDVKNVERHGQYDFLKLRLTFLEKKKKKKFWKIKAENETSVLNLKKNLEPILGLCPRVSCPIPGNDPRV